MHPQSTTARPFAARVAPWLVALALLLRVLLPALHHHHHHHGAPHPDAAGAVEVCSCGHEHERTPLPPRGDGQLDAALADQPHFCIACEVELGTPGACAELPPPLPTPLAVAAPLPTRGGRVAAAATDRRPPTRAPPARSC